MKWAKECSTSLDASIRAVSTRVSFALLAELEVIVTYKDLKLHHGKIMGSTLLASSVSRAKVTDPTKDSAKVLTAFKVSSVPKGRTWPFIS